MMPPWSRWQLWGAVIVVALLGSATAALFWPRTPPAPIATPAPHPPPPTPVDPAAPQAAPAALPPPIPPAPPAAQAVAPFDIPQQIASVEQIAARRDPTTTLFRLAEDPLVLVVDFADFHTQALMLNRVAALIEKADMPRDRVVGEAELDAHIRATGEDPDHYYIGHDYRAADLARFFQRAAAQGMPLNPQEQWLRDLLDRAGWLREGAVGALISIPAVNEEVDAATRITVLRHELSHAVYFTDPAYVALTHHMWVDMLTAPERDAVRQFLGHDGYDTADEDLMANEGQAYLIHTRDPRYFTPAMLGMSDTRAAAVRAAFIAMIPEPWLKASALAVAPAGPAPAAQPGTAAHHHARKPSTPSAHPHHRLQ